MTFQGRVYEKGIIDKGYEKEVLEKGYQKGVVTEMRKKNIRTYQRAIKTVWYFKNNSFSHFWGLQLA